MDKNTVLITGASGFIGTALIARLRKQYYIIGIDKVLHKDRDSSVLWYKVDISDKKHLNETLREIKEKVSSKIDYVFHLAAYYDMLNEENEMYRKTNEIGTRYLLDNLIDFDVNNFIFTSSTIVMKPTKGDEKLNEESALSTKLYYGKSKIAGEKIVLEKKEKIRTTIFRLSGVYSNDCRLIPLANQIAFTWRKDFGYKILPGKGEGGISYVHIEDVLDAFEKAMFMAKQIPSGSIFVLSEDEYVSINNLYNKIFCEIYGKKLNPIHLPKWLVCFFVYITNKFYLILGREFFFRPWMINLTDKKYRFDIDNAKRMLNWYPRFLLKEYIKVIIKNLKNDPKRWFEINKIAPGS
jgi:nucleoside-diphosphate-sugar epimerase